MRLKNLMTVKTLFHNYVNYIYDILCYNLPNHSFLNASGNRLLFRLPNAM